jgi:hypothetical protein
MRGYQYYVNPMRDYVDPVVHAAENFLDLMPDARDPDPRTVVPVITHRIHVILRIGVSTRCLDL